MDKVLNGCQDSPEEPRKKYWLQSRLLRKQIKHNHSVQAKEELVGFNQSTFPVFLILKEIVVVDIYDLLILSRVWEMYSYIFLSKIQKNLNTKGLSFVMPVFFFLTFNGLTLTGTVPISEKLTMNGFFYSILSVGILWLHLAKLCFFLVLK